MNIRSLIDSFNFAINGLVHAIRTQRNMKIHVLMTIFVSFLALFLGVGKTDFILLLISITLVISAELFNTAIESAVDATTNHYHPMVKIAKNTAAAAVLVTALNAMVVGYIVFFDKIANLTMKSLTIVKQSNLYLVATVLLIVCLIVLFIKATFGEGTPLRGGMPSGHTAIAFSLATMMSYISFNPIVVTLSFVMAIIVAQSRVDSKVHNFIEVVVGSVIGILTTIIVFKLFGF